MDTTVATADKTNRNERYRVIFAGICALILTVGLARFAYTPMLPIMRDQIGLSHLSGGWLATINYAGYMGGALLAASINDLARKFMLYRIGLVVAVLSTAAMGLTEHFLLWAILRFIAGFAGTAGLLLASGLVLNWLIRQGHRPELGLHFMGLGLGIAVSGVAVAAMAGWLSWDQQWVGLGIFGLVFFLPAWWWLPAPGAARISATPSAATPPPVTKRWLWLLITSYFCAGFGFAIGATFIVAILVDLPLLADKGGWVWIVVGLAAAPAAFLWDRIASGMGQIRALKAAYGLQAFAMILPILTESVALNMIGAMLFGATFVGIVSLTLTVIGRRFSANPAKAMAKMTLSYGVAQIIAPAMAGTIATATGNYHAALVVTAIMLLGGILALQLLINEERRVRQ